jgi:PAS domain S-box-containing protein
MTVDKLALLEQELSAIYRNVPGILFYIAVEPDGEFRFLSVSHAWLVATGLTQEQVLGSLVRDIIPAPSRDMVLNRYREAILTGHTVRWEEVSVYPAGQRYGEVAVTPLYDASGVATHLIGIVHDITERKVLDESHREIEARQAFLLKLSDSFRSPVNPAEIQLTAARLLSEHLQVNRISHADIEGTDMIVRLSHANGVSPYIGRELISVGAALLAECRRGNFVTVNDVQTDPRLTDSERANLLGNETRAFSVAMLQKAGPWMSALCVESVTPRLWTRAEIELIRDVAERTWDAVDRARAEEVLRGSEQRLRLALHATGGGSWSWEAHTNHLDWDDRFRAQFGFTSGEPPTFGAWLACVHEEDRQQVLRLLDEMLYTNKSDTWDNTYRIVRPNGVLWMQSLGRADRDAKGQVMRLTGLNWTSLNIGARKKQCVSGSTNCGSHSTPPPRAFGRGTLAPMKSTGMTASVLNSGSLQESR